MSLCGGSGWALTSPVLFTGMLSIGIMLLAHWISRQRYFPGRASFVVLHVCILWWLSTAGLELAAQGASCKVFWAGMAWPGIVAVPTLWAVFLWQYVNSIRESLAPQRYLPLAIAPLVAWLLALVNPWQAFYGPATAAASSLPGAPVVYEHGVLFHGTAVYVYVMMLFCLAVVSRAVITSHGLHRRHYLAFGVVTCVPWAANISYVVFGWTLFGFDPTPFSFAFTLVAFSWLILSVRLFDLLPVARHLLLEELPDPVLVIDAKGRVIEANPAALRLADLRGGWQGRALLGWPVFGSELHGLLQAQASGEPLLTLGEPPRYFEVRARAIERITRSGSHVLGRMVYLREVTERHRSELQLAEALALSEERLRTISSLHEQLQEQALCDPLTGLYNRRYLNEFFAREQARGLREGTPIALALIDLDHFKQLNDRHGHQVGDDMLKGVAGFLECSLRSTDAVFRIGGEEFLLILPGADSEEARLRLEAVRRELADTGLATRAGELHVTLSAGLAVWPAQGQSLDELVQVADAALYDAKRNGRNQVCVLARVSL